MSVRTSFNIEARVEPYTLIIEPWANEYYIEPDSNMTLVAIHPNRHAEFSREEGKDRLILTVESGDSTYELWNGEVFVDGSFNPIPGTPHFKE